MYIKFVPLNFLSTTSILNYFGHHVPNLLVVLDSLTEEPTDCFLIKLPFIVPNSVFSKLSFPVTFASIKIPLFKNLLPQLNLGNGKYYTEYQTVSKIG